MGRPTKLTEVVVTEMKRLRDSGMSVTEVARRLNVSIASVSRTVGERHPAWPAEQRVEMRRMRERGSSNRKIAQTFGRSLSQVSESLNDTPKAEEARKLRMEGLSVRDIASRLGVPYTRASAWTAGSEGVTRRKVSPAIRESVLAFHARGSKPAAIAWLLDISESSVRAIIRADQVSDAPE
ncbi:helix-turn-helix domain-containing protein [Xanthomonas citri]|uniref:helix-turn-helix domain-containing protein n=1 Tax=Xanthomonas citri TaxID=346 RepID=UPI00103D51BD|nr:helix-turn-helix domain-containing protein [Xanthomonas citri]